MELYPLKVFLAVANEKSFSRAAEKMLRTQPAISLAVQRLETDLGEKLIDRSSTPPILTDAGRIVVEYARRFENLEAEMQNCLGRTARQLRGPSDHRRQRIHVFVPAAAHRELSPDVSEGKSASPAQPVEQDPGPTAGRRSGTRRHQLRSRRYRLISKVIFTDHLAFVVSPQHRFANRQTVSITELGMETFIAHNVLSPTAKSFCENSSAIECR